MNNLSCHLCYPVLNDLHDIDDHDAEQRQVIEQLRKELELLKADDAERCTLIQDMEEEERRKDQEIEEARRTAEYWKAEHLAGNTKIEQQAQQIARLREALEGCLAQIQEDIKEFGPCEHDVNICVCPLKILASEAQQALKEHP